MNRGSAQAGFTLVEMIVSLAITTIIAAFVFGFATSLARLWSRTESGVGTELDVQITLDQIAMDLEAAVFQDRQLSDGTPVPMLAVSAISKDPGDAVNYELSGHWEDGSAKPAGDHFDPQNDAYGWAGSWLRFFTASPSFNAVGYQLIRRDIFGRARYALYRSVIRHDDTIGVEVNIIESDYPDQYSENALKSPSLNALLLEDVIDFGVRFYVYDDVDAQPGVPEGLRLVFPASASGALDAGDLEHIASLSSGTNYGARYPDLVEVFIRALDDVGSEQLYRLEEEGVADLSYQEIINSHSRVYSRLVKLPGREPAL